MGLAATLTACASMSLEECRYADWSEVGRSDAQRGHTSENLARHRKSCAKAGYPVNSERYYSGYNRGLKDYCVAATAFNAARYDKSKPQQCLDSSVRSSDFARAYEYGLNVRDADMLSASLQQEISNLQRTMEEMDARLHAIHATLDHEDLSNYEAIELHEESIAISAKLSRDHARLDKLSAEASEVRYQLEQMIRKFQTGKY